MLHFSAEWNVAADVWEIDCCLVSFFKILSFPLSSLRLRQKCEPPNLKVTEFVWTFRIGIKTIIFCAHNEN